jgi:hypothetical protein
MLLVNPTNQYFRFVDVGRGDFVNVLSMRIFPELISPKPKP